GTGRLVLETAAGGDFDLPVSSTRTITITITGNIATTVTPGQVIPNTATVQWTSLDGDFTNAPNAPRSPFNPASTERTGAGGVNDYSNTDSADIQIRNLELQKTILSTSELATTDADAVVIGEIVRYRVQLAIPEFGTPTSFQFVDLLPAGMQFVGDGN